MSLFDRKARKGVLYENRAVLSSCTPRAILLIQHDTPVL